MSWAARRQFLYAMVALVIVLGIAGWAGYAVFSTTSTCMDGKQNQNETGVDCGGACSRLCADVARAPVIKWSRAFRSGPNLYTLAAYVENNNPGASAMRVPYAFRLFDDKNLLILEKNGVADLPPMQTVPVVETGVDVGNRTVARAFLEFSKVPVWNRTDAAKLPSVRITAQELAGDASRLSSTVVNEGNSDARNITLIAVLFDKNGTAQAASKSFIERIPRGGSQTVVFTWPEPAQNIVRAEVTAVPSL